MTDSQVLHNTCELFTNSHNLDIVIDWRFVYIPLAAYFIIIRRKMQFTNMLVENSLAETAQVMDVYKSIFITCT